MSRLTSLRLLSFAAGYGLSVATEPIAACSMETERDSLHMLQRFSQRTSSEWSVMAPDPNVLTWEDAPSAGHVSNGLLSVPLDLFDPDSPTLVLPVTMRFADTQPAPKGLMLIHCGGPGSSSSCVRYTYGRHLQGYDVFSITQRGMGASEPALNCANSKLPESCPSTGCQVSDFTDCPCALLDGTPQLGEIWADIDPANESQVMNLFQKREEWGKRCAASEKFQLKNDQGKSYNFLNYVGTQFLVYDLERLRKGVGAKKLNVYGYSYGTYVGGVYASVFSETSGRIVLDGDMEASPRKDAQATGDAIANDKFVAYLLHTCKDAPDCPLANPEENYDKIIESARKGQLTALTESKKEFPLSVGLLMAYLQAESLSNSGRYFARALQTLAQLASSKEEERRDAVAFILDGFCFVKGVSTWSKYDICVGPGHTNENEPAAVGTTFADPYLEQCAVWGLDLAGYFGVSDLMNQWRMEKIERGAAGLAAAVGDMAGYFLWPLKATPTAPMGSAIVKPLIIGNLFDTATSYSWAQDMKKSFPEGSMITWQGMGHTFPSRATDYNRAAIEHCWGYVEAYLQNGTLPVNGMLCWQKTNPPVS